MKKAGTLTFLISLAAVCLACAQSDSDEAAIGVKIEHNLLSPEVISGGETATFTLKERMSRYNVPGVSIAVVNDGEIVWAQGYGEKTAGSGDPVTPQTLFQAASISKPVAASVVLNFVQEDRLDLDADVSDYLLSWKLPPGRHSKDRPVTFRHLLRHTGGITVHGFRGYNDAFEEVPELPDILDGVGAANSAPIRVANTPGMQWQYSGGGYTILQQSLEDVAGKPFDQIAQQTLLGPLGMDASTFEQPLPPSLRARAAEGHRSSGEPVAGGWHTYPEQAAAGFWTTPGDLALWIAEVQQAVLNGSGRVLTQETAMEKLRSGLGGWGLGLKVGGEGNSLYFSHTGANQGYQAFLIAYTYIGKGAVILTNSDNGARLAREIILTIAHHYGWPGWSY